MQVSELTQENETLQTKATQLRNLLVDFEVQDGVKQSASSVNRNAEDLTNASEAQLRDAVKGNLAKPN